MDPMATGLRYRVRRVGRQIAEQHKHMHELVQELDQALAEQLPGKAKDVLLRVCGAMHAHFALEDEVFFPALHGLHPEHAGELEELSREHADFAVALERLRQQLEESSLERFGTAFHELLKELASHEGREERLARALTESLAEPG